MRKKPVPKLREKTTAYELLSEVCRLIAEEPRRYNQEWWISRADKKRDLRPPSNQFPACGTVCCVAGWVETLRSTPDRVARLASTEVAPTSRCRIATEAAKTLGIGDAAAELFNGCAINDMCRELGIIPPKQGTRAYARLGIRHIRRFQRLYASELKAKIVRPIA